MPLFRIETTVDNPKQLDWVRDEIFDAAVSVGATLVNSRNTDRCDLISLVFEHDDEAFLRTTIHLVDPSAGLTALVHRPSNTSGIGAPRQ